MVISMKVVIQVSSNASVTIDNEVVGKIDKGYTILVGICNEDTKEIVEKMANKIVGLRIFPDSNGKTNLSLKDVNGSILSISQFTLYADCKKGNRPSFTNAGGREIASSLYDYFNDYLVSLGYHVERGKFGADMYVSITNEGPFTIVLDSKEVL